MPNAGKPGVANDSMYDESAAGLMGQRLCRIREVAYFRAETRGFEPGHEWEDWFAAELEVDRASRPWPTP